MLYIARNKLDQILAGRGWSLVSLAKACGISRQSLYAMFEQRSVFNSTFEKVLHKLGVDYRTITTPKSPAVGLMTGAPDRIRRVVLSLVEFCEAQSAMLILFGSRARGKETIRADWDFGVYFSERDDDRALRLLKQRCVEAAFPYRIDVVNLNRAPTWFLETIRGENILLHGGSSLEEILQRRAA